MNTVSTGVPQQPRLGLGPANNNGEFFLGHPNFESELAISELVIDASGLRFRPVTVLTMVITKLEEVDRRIQRISAAATCSPAELALVLAKEQASDLRTFIEDSKHYEMFDDLAVLANDFGDEAERLLGELVELGGTPGTRSGGQSAWLGAAAAFAVPAMGICAMTKRTRRP